MKYRTLALVLLVPTGFLSSLLADDASSGSGRPSTFCNPMDLPYRFQLEPPVRREAADPTMVVYKNEYWLFPSKSGGYWHSADCLHWSYVPCTSMPVEDYAPTAEVVGDQLIWTASGAGGIFATTDPLKDNWTKVASEDIDTDPDLFLAKDGRLFLYGGCSDNKPIHGVELDTKTFLPKGKPVACLAGDPANHGWETLKSDEWVEGSWMTEHDGTYYLQFAAPGTEIKDYGDGVYTSTDPLGPFTFAPYTPFSFKPTGYVCGVGHSSTFQDLSGQYWHIGTMTISVRHQFERRLGLFRAGFTSDGQLYCNTYLGDYPQYAPGVSLNLDQPTGPSWMLLSYHKTAEASSTLEKFPVKNAFDESIYDWWSAKTGDKGEWLKVDLGKQCRIEAIQTNFADQDAQATGMLKNGDAYQYVIEVSDDGTTWNPCIDKSQNQVDAPHDYVQLPAPVTARYVRLTNIHCPAGAKFSVSGFRIFGSGLGDPPAIVEGVTAKRLPDSRKADVSWSPVHGADFYIVRYGLGPDRLFSNYQVYQGTKVTINSLNIGVAYTLTVDAVNDSGVTRGTEMVQLPVPESASPK